MASGLVLVEAAGGLIATRGDGRWLPFDRLEKPSEPDGGNLRRWKQPILAEGPTEHDTLLAAVAR